MIFDSPSKLAAFIAELRRRRVFRVAARRRAKAMVAMDAIQQHALRKGLDKMSLEEINAGIQEVRKERPERGT